MTAITTLATQPTLRLWLPDGARGTRETLKQMRESVRRSVPDPDVVREARRIVSHIPGKQWMGEIRAVFNWVRNNITYRLDPYGLETVADARDTREMGCGDCDDISVILATYLHCIGHPCRFVAVGFGEPGDGCFTHVYTQCRPADEAPRWISLDATEPQPMGWFPPGATNIMRCRVGMVP